MQEKRRKRKRSGQISGVQVMFAAILSIGLILAINSARASPRGSRFRPPTVASPPKSPPSSDTGAA